MDPRRSAWTRRRIAVCDSHFASSGNPSREARRKYVCAFRETDVAARVGPSGRHTRGPSGRHTHDGGRGKGRKVGSAMSDAAREAAKNGRKVANKQRKRLERLG